MLVENQIVEVRWNNKTRSHYEKLGYRFSKSGEYFQAKVEDLTNGSKIKINLTCDFCRRNIEREYGRYLRQVSESNTASVAHYDTCTKCYNQKAKLTVKNKLTLQEELNLIQKYRDSTSLVDIRNEFKITESKIYEILKKHGVESTRDVWLESHSEKLKEIYEFETWEFILSELAPFKANTITEKAMGLGMSRKNPFSEDEIMIIKLNYVDSSYSDLMKMLPSRTAASIQTKANELGVRKREYWSEEDIEKFKIMYPLYPNSELAKHFNGRSESSLMSMAVILNISKNIEAFEFYRSNAKAEILEKLIAFAKALGRTPTQDEVTENKDMPGMVTYHRYFGSYAEACESAGLDVNITCFGRQNLCTSINGDVCLSLAEKEITDILIENKIRYVKERLYKKISPSIPQASRMRCDWFVNNNIIVEYFGLFKETLSDNKILNEYHYKTKEKIEICRENNIPLIALYPSDLEDNYRGMIEKFSDYNIKINITFQKCL